MGGKSGAKSEDNFNVWLCCGGEFTQSEIAQHLQEAHGLQKPLQGNRRMIQHLDGADWSQSDYEWIINGDLTLYQSVRAVRVE